MSNFIPNITKEDLNRIIDRDFPVESHAKIKAAFDKVKSKEKLRVIAACLKKSSCNADRAIYELNNADGFWREIISDAEYPKVKKSRNLTEQQISEKQQQQYMQWFNKPK